MLEPKYNPEKRNQQIRAFTLSANPYPLPLDELVEAGALQETRGT